MQLTKHRTALAVVTALTCSAAVVQGQKAEEAKSNEAKSDAKVAARVGGDVITLAEVDAKALGTNMKLAQQVYDARREALDQIVVERVLGPKAKEAGQSVDEYLRARIAEKTQPITDEAVEAFYNANRNRMRGQTLEQIAGQIRSYLARQQQDQARQAVIDEVIEDAGVTIALEPPRAEVVIAKNDPVKGPKDAEVTIVEYSDFQ